MELRNNCGSLLSLRKNLNDVKSLLPLLYLTLLLITTTGRGQSGKLFSVDRELSSSLINHVYQDHRNIIWIATSDGLNRYDGSKFTIYKKLAGDTTSLLNNYVRVVFEDSRMRLFVGFFNGVQYYDYATDTFHDVPLLLTDGKPFPAHIMSIRERQNGDILIATSGHGVFVIKAGSSELKAHQVPELSPSFMVGYLYEDSDANIWVASQDRGLFRIDRNGERKHYFPTAENGTIFSLCEDNDKNLYAGSFANGLYAYDKASDTFQNIPCGPNLSVNKLYLSRSGDILVGTEGDGLKIFDPKTRKISSGDFNVNTLDFSKSKIHSIMEDKKGNVWLGIHQKGVVLLPSRTNHFKYYGYKSVKHNIIGSHMVTAVLKDRNGTLWIGTDGDGTYGLRNGSDRPVHFIRPNNPTAPSTVLSLHEDSFGTLWLGSYDRGLARLNKNTGVCEYVNHLFEKRNGDIPRVFAITEDTNKNLWVATMGSGLYCMNLETGKVEHYIAPQGTNYRDDANTLNSDWLFSLYLTSDDKLFIGTVDGMGCLDLKTRSFNSTFNVNRLLPGTMINGFSEDSNHTIWIATTDGLTSLDMSQREFTTYTTRDGLPSNMVYALQEDTMGNMWISTNSGISRMNLKKKNFINYYSDDGLQGNEFSRAASFADDNGIIHFGGMNGITFFNPTDISTEVKTLEVHLTGFYIHNQPVKKGMTSEAYPIVNTSVMESDTFQLSQKDNSFTIEFSCMEFTNPERITYLYKLENESDWITLPAGTNNVTFSNLNPGSYVFKVRAKDYNTYSDTKQISIVVHPFWYFSNIAKAGYAIVFLTIVGIFVQQARQRINAKRKIQEHLHAKQLHEAKLQFFINIAHEIRTPMSLIISPLKRLLLKDKDRERQRAYATMNQNSERIVLLINQLMDIQKIDQGQMTLLFRETEMISFIREICLAFKDEVSSRKINLRFSHRVKRLNAFIDPNNFDKVLLNIISNALKFTPDNGEINVQLNVPEKSGNHLKGTYERFQIIVSDTGIGIPNGELEKIFDCFYQTRESQQFSKEGTGIGLHLTKSIVQLHHGSIRAENNPDAPGCRFIINLPLGKEHLREKDIATEIAEPVLESDSLHYAEATRPVLPEIKVRSKTKHRVLVVDDDKKLRDYLCVEMGSDYHMDKCADGKEALAYILKNSPDLVISDIMMPEMDGITLCRKVKQNVNINHIPVVLLTARKDEQYNIEGLGIGADAYIVKPFNIEIVRKTVQSIIRNRELLRNSYSGNQLQSDRIRDIDIKSPDEKLLGKVMDTINENLANPALSVEMLAHEIGISRVHLHRKLKGLTNQSTRDLIRNVRLQQAGKLLSEKHFNISEVAFAVGFTNVAHFSSAFKEFYGVSPSEYMESQRAI